MPHNPIRFVAKYPATGNVLMLDFFGRTLSQFIDLDDAKKAIGQPLLPPKTHPHRPPSFLTVLPVTWHWFIPGPIKTLVKHHYSDLPAEEKNAYALMSEITPEELILVSDRQDYQVSRLVDNCIIIKVISVDIIDGTPLIVCEY